MEEKVTRHRLKKSYTLNSKTIETLVELSDSLDLPQARVIDRAVQCYKEVQEKHNKKK